jgi:predicted lipid-binding transport protein (Tim44 family)
MVCFTEPADLDNAMNFDPLNILLLAVALVVFWRLKSVLGTRTGTEKPPIDPFETRRTEAPKAQESDGSVVQFPRNAPAAPVPPSDEDEPAPPVWAGYAEPGTELAATLERFVEKDPSFTPKSFVEGAKAAYEMIIEGFAKGDKSTLKPLLSKDVFEGFARAIDERGVQGLRVDSRFVGIDKAVIQSAGLAGNKASVTLQFVSELITATYDKAGDVIDGDPRHVQEVTDVWTFERDITSSDPNWRLVATQALV